MSNSMRKTSKDKSKDKNSSSSPEMALTGRSLKQQEQLRIQVIAE